MVQEKGPKSGDSSPEKNMTCSSSISGSTYRNIKVGGKGRRDVLSHSGKEDMGESTDVQSTGFSVHGDSGRGPGSTGKEFFFFQISSCAASCFFKRSVFLHHSLNWMDSTEITKMLKMSVEDISFQDVYYMFPIY